MIMINVKLQDRLGDVFASLSEIAGPEGRIHLVVEVAEDSRYEALKPHVRTLSLVKDTYLTVRKISRPPVVVRWTIGGG
jgi:hypothetical protein